MSVKLSKNFVTSKMSNLLREYGDAAKAATVFSGLRLGCDLRHEFSRGNVDAYMVESRLNGAFGEPYAVIADRVSQVVRLAASPIKMDEVIWKTHMPLVNELNNSELHGYCWARNCFINYEVSIEYHGVQDKRYLEEIASRVIQFFEEDMKKVGELWAQWRMWDVSSDVAG